VRRASGIEIKPAEDKSEEAAEVPISTEVVESKGKRKEKKPKPYEGLTGEIEVLYVDIVGDTFWVERPWLLL
jgi:hypothetical protein